MNVKVTKRLALVASLLAATLFGAVGDPAVASAQTIRAPARQPLVKSWTRWKARVKTWVRRATGVRTRPNSGFLEYGYRNDILSPGTERELAEKGLRNVRDPGLRRFLAYGLEDRQLSRKTMRELVRSQLYGVPID